MMNRPSTLLTPTWRHTGVGGPIFTLICLHVGVAR
jgi:hypothetical protein